MASAACLTYYILHGAQGPSTCAEAREWGSGLLGCNRLHPQRAVSLRFCLCGYCAVGCSAALQPAPDRPGGIARIGPRTQVPCLQTMNGVAGGAVTPPGWGIPQGLLPGAPHRVRLPQPGQVSQGTPARQDKSRQDKTRRSETRPDQTRQRQKIAFQPGSIDFLPQHLDPLPASFLSTTALTPGGILTLCSVSSWEQTSPGTSPTAARRLAALVCQWRTLLPACLVCWHPRLWTLALCAGDVPAVLSAETYLVRLWPCTSHDGGP